MSQVPNAGAPQVIVKSVPLEKCRMGIIKRDRISLMCSENTFEHRLPYTILDTGDTALNKTSPCFLRFSFQ